MTKQLTLAAELIATEPELTFPISISIDNQAAILTGESSLLNPDRFYMATKIIKRQHRREFNITVRWVPGHSDVFGNEEADREKASEGPYHNSPHLVGTLQAHWLHLWQQSPRYAHLNTIDPDVLNRSFIKLTSPFQDTSITSRKSTHPTTHTALMPLRLSITYSLTAHITPVPGRTLQMPWDEMHHPFNICWQIQVPRLHQCLKATYGDAPILV